MIVDSHPSKRTGAQGALFPRAQLTPGEVEAYRRRPKVTVSAWAEKNRWVTDGPWQGPWRNDQTPYLVEPMDAWARPGVRKVVVVGVPQSGKTQIIYNCWAYGAAVRQAWSMIVLSDKDVAGNVASERIAPIINASPALSRLKTSSAKDVSKEKIRLQGSVTLMSWASSIAKLSTFPVEHVFLDEVDDYPSWKPGSRHANPIALAEARTTSYRYTGKVLEVSTTSIESGPVWQELLRCQMIQVYMARCPACGRRQIMKSEQIRWDDSLADDPDRVEAEGLAWYECEHCGAPWSETERRAAVRRGGYRPHRWDAEESWWAPIPEGDIPGRPVSIGYHFSAFYSPFVALARIAAQVIRSKDDPEEEHDLYNKRLALPYRHEQAARSEDIILRLCDDRPPGLVPAGTAALTAAVDVQRNGFYLTIRAWRPGPDGDSALIRAAFVMDWSALEKMLSAHYRDSEGRPHPVIFGLVDSGDGEKTREIYNWCAAHPPLTPSKGQQRLAQPYNIKPIATHPGLKLIHINTTHYKNYLAAKLSIAPSDPGAWTLHGNYEETPNGERLPGALLDFARQLCAETRNDRGVWEQVRSRPNHYLDCEVAQLVCADLLGVRDMAQAEAQASGEAAPDTPPPPRSFSRW